MPMPTPNTDSYPGVVRKLFWTSSRQAKNGALLIQLSKGTLTGSSALLTE